MGRGIVPALYRYFIDISHNDPREMSLSHFIGKQFARGQPASAW